MLRILTVLAITVLLTFTSMAFGQTLTIKNLTVTSICADDIDVANQALLNAQAFFRAYGYETADIPIALEFLNTVEVALGDDKLRVYGYYDREANNIKVTTWSDPWLRERKAFGLSVTKELHQSIITHEMIHYLLDHINGKVTGQGVQEYVAYAGQIWSLSDATRKQVLDKFDNPPAFKYINQINGMHHALNPHRFGVRSYVDFYETNGELLSEIIDEKLNMDTDIENNVL